MNPFGKISAENLHHAYLVVGDREVAHKHVENFLQKSFGISGVGNPDMQHIVCDTLTIDLARKIAVDAGRKSFGGGRKFFLIEANIVG